MKLLILCLSIFLNCLPSFAAEEINLSCSVVETGIAQNTVLEEGLGSIYDIDNQGNIMADEDSTGGSVRINGKKINLGLGQGGWSSEKKDTTFSVESFEYPNPAGGSDLTGVQITVNDDQGEFVWKVFTALKIVKISYTDAKHKQGKKNKYKNSPLATLDCSGVQDIRRRLR